MKKKTNSGEETLRAIRRNSAYQTARKSSLLFSIIFIFCILAIVFLYSSDFSKSEKLITFIISMVFSGSTGFFLYHYIQSHYDQSDALIQVAKFQERSLRKRNDALSIVEKIREEVSEEHENELVKTDNETRINESINKTSDTVEKPKDPSADTDKADDSADESEN